MMQPANEERWLVEILRCVAELAIVMAKTGVTAIPSIKGCYPQK